MKSGHVRFLCLVPRWEGSCCSTQTVLGYAESESATRAQSPAQSKAPRVSLLKQHYCCPRWSSAGRWRLSRYRWRTEARGTKPSEGSLYSWLLRWTWTHTVSQLASTPRRTLTVTGQIWTAAPHWSLQKHLALTLCYCPLCLQSEIWQHLGLLPDPGTPPAPRSGSGRCLCGQIPPGCPGSPSVYWCLWSCEGGRLKVHPRTAGKPVQRCLRHTASPCEAGPALKKNRPFWPPPD